MSYQPPYTINAKIIHLISAISEQVGVVQRDFLDASPQLRKVNRIKTITGTLAIEGSTLSEEQVGAVLDGKLVSASPRELAEVEGAIAAYEQLQQLDPFKLDDLRRAHQLMMGDLLPHAGRFRNKAVGVYQGQDIIHVAPPAHRVSGLMGDLFQWINQSDQHPLISSTVFHYEFEFIHPFIDGNGRMGRLWQTLLLAQWKPLFFDLPLESVVKEHQQAYYQALGSADEAVESTLFIEFMLEAILQTLQKNVPANAPPNAPPNAPVNLHDLKTTDAILYLLRGNPYLTRKEMAAQIGKDIRTIGRAIEKLGKNGRLRRVGSAKAGHWELL